MKSISKKQMEVYRRVVVGFLFLWMGYLMVDCRGGGEKIDFEEHKYTRRAFLKNKWIDLRGNMRQGSPYKHYSGTFVWYETLRKPGQENKTVREAVLQYKNGKVWGKGRIYYPSGRLRQKVRYFNGLRHEKSIWYYDKKKRMKTKGRYSMDRKNGIWKWYYRTGVLSGEAFYHDDALEGVYRIYYENRGLKRMAVYKNGKKHGDYEWYYPNGRLQEKGFYKEDLQEGTWFYYRQDGELHKEVVYLKGEVQTKK